MIALNGDYLKLGEEGYCESSYISGATITILSDDYSKYVEEEEAKIMAFIKPSKAFICGIKRHIH